jgi:hypothetical protein
MRLSFWQVQKLKERNEFRKREGYSKGWCIDTAVLHLLQQSRESFVMAFFLLEHIHEEKRGCYVAFFLCQRNYLFVPVKGFFSSFTSCAIARREKRKRVSFTPNPNSNYDSDDD